MKRIALLLLLCSFYRTTAQETPVPLGLSVEQIALYPEPNVQILYPQDDVIYDRLYRRVVEPLQLYDAPAGNLVEDLGKGFNFVTLNNSEQGDWAQVSIDRWVRSSSLSKDVVISRYGGIKLPSEQLPYQVAWTLRHVRPSTSPGLEDNPDGEFMYRYTLVNLYSTVEIDGYRWYQIGVNQWVHQFDVAKVTPIERPEGVNTNKWVSVDLYEQILVAYEGTTPVFSTLISSGLSQWATREGLFNVYFRPNRTLMSGANGLPDFYFLEEVPWTMYFDGDIGLHGTYWHDGFGYRRSHGCVNMSITDAKWLYEWSSDVRDSANPDSLDLSVYVYSSGKYTS